METSQLIQALSNNVKRVKPLPCPRNRCCAWFVPAFLCVSIGIAIMGIRHDMDAVMNSPEFILETLLILLSAIFAAGGAFVLSIPGAEKKYTRIIPLLLLACWLLCLGLSFGLESSSPTFDIGTICLRNILVFGIIPGVALFFLVRKAAVTKEKWTSVLVLIAAGAIGSFGLQFTCASHSPLHLFFFHFLPVVIIASIGAWLGKKFINWEKRIENASQDIT